MTENDPERLADELDQEADDLGRRNEELKDEIADTRQDWQRKREDESVPGAVPPEGQNEGGQGEGDEDDQDRGDSDQSERDSDQSERDSDQSERDSDHSEGNSDQESES
jgi:hypothetical protein